MLYSKRVIKAQSVCIIGHQKGKNIQEDLKKQKAIEKWMKKNPLPDVSGWTPKDIVFWVLSEIGVPK